MKDGLAANLRRAAYLLSEGVQGLAVAPGQTLACLVSLAVAGCLLALVASFGSVAVRVLDRAGTHARVLVYLKDEVPSARVGALLSEVKARPDVERAEYVSRAEDRSRNAALLPRDVVASLPADAIPGQHAIEVAFREGAAGSEGAVGLAKFLKGLEGVDVVAEPPVGAARIRAVAAAVGFGRVILALLAGLLLAGTLFFVVGTLTRTMESRRDQMVILRLVGATDVFVRAPIYVQGILQGTTGLVLGGVVALVVAGATNRYLAADLGVALQVPTWPAATIWLTLAGGAALGALGALIATRRRLP